MTQLWLLMMLLIAPPTTAPDAVDAGPRDAVKAFRSAMESPAVDATARLRSMVYAKDEHERPLANAAIDVIVAGKKLADASRRQFGDSGEGVARGGLSDAAESLAAVDGATINLSLDGSVALIVLPGRNDRPLSLVHVGSDWQIDLLDFANLRPAPSTTATTRPASATSQPSPSFIAECNLLITLARGLNEVAELTEAGRYRTPADVRAAVQDRFHTAVARSLNRPSTQPVTQPSTQNAR